MPRTKVDFTWISHFCLVGLLLMNSSAIAAGGSKQTVPTTDPQNPGLSAATVEGRVVDAVSRVPIFGALVAVPVTASILLIIKQVFIPKQDAKT